MDIIHHIYRIVLAIEGKEREDPLFYPFWRKEWNALAESAQFSKLLTHIWKLYLHNPLPESRSNA
jgi:hypothetical protein